MLSINTNLSSLIAQQSMSSATNKLNQAIERMTTGYKINGAKDNAANYSISTNMTTKINSYMVAEDNVAMGLDMLSTANGSLDQISDKLTRLRALATQASNGTYGAQSLTAINSEANALVDEINRIYSTAEYNGRKLFTGTEINATPAAATFGMARAASTNTTYTDEEVAAMTKFSTVDITQDLASGIYSISTADELAKLASMANNAKLSEIVSGQTSAKGNYEFVLANDIDLKEWCEAHISDGGWEPIGKDALNSFVGIFNGNGHFISNLILDDSGLGGGLFGYTRGATITDLGLENINIKGGEITGGLVSRACRSTIENCYVTGKINSSLNSVGGLLGIGAQTQVYNCYTEVTLSGRDYIGGLVGQLVMDGPVEPQIKNSFSIGSIAGDEGVAGLIGYVNASSAKIENSFTLCSVSGTLDVDGFVALGNANVSCNNVFSVQSAMIATQMSAEEISAPANLESMGFTEANGWAIVNGQPVLAYSMAARNAGGGLSGSNYVTLQVGINADSHSQIGLEFGFTLDGIESLRNIGLDISVDYLTEIDNMLNTVTAKATEYGAVQNRLESALDEIAIQYDNLVSSRSTLRDADIAEVSSQYIQQQILQQASATLLATANQSPSIALQLI